MDNEAAYTLADNTIDHGHFLELILLLGKYDVCLTNPVEQEEEGLSSPYSPKQRQTLS